MTRAAAPLVAGVVAATAAFLVATALSDGGSPPAESAAAGRAVFARMGCGGCHRLAAASTRGQIGPDLDQRLPAHTAASLRAKILDPAASAPAAGFATMPVDFGDRMSRRELDALVAFLLESARR